MCCEEDWVSPRLERLLDGQCAPWLIITQLSYHVDPHAPPGTWCASVQAKASAQLLRALAGAHTCLWCGVAEPLRGAETTLPVYLPYLAQLTLNPTRRPVHALAGAGGGVFSPTVFLRYLLAALRTKYFSSTQHFPPFPSSVCGDHLRLLRGFLYVRNCACGRALVGSRGQGERPDRHTDIRHQDRTATAAFILLFTGPCACTDPCATF